MINPIFKLGDVCKTFSGGTPSRVKRHYFDGGIPWVKITDMLQGNVITTDETLSASGIANSSAKLLPIGTVLISIFATIGRTSVLGIEAATNQAIAGVVPTDFNQLDPRYLRYFLDSKHGYLNREARGVAQPNINQGILRALDISLPPLEEQRRIVDLLSRADGIVRLRRDAKKKAAGLIPAIFLEMFGDPATNPKGWPVQSLGEVAAFMSGGTPPKAREELWSGTLPWVSPKDMKVDCIADAIDHVSDSVLTATNLKLVPIGSILIVVRGMILVHTVPIAITSTPVTINQDLKALMPIKSIDPSFLLWALKVQHPKLLALVDTAAHGTKKLDTEKIQAVGIPVPPLQIQQQFIARADSVASIIAQQDSALIKAKATFEALLARSFTTEALA